MTAAAVSVLSGPYCSYSSASDAGSRSVAAPRIDNRLETPGFSATSKRTVPSLSVTALLIFFSICFGSSRRPTVPLGESSDFDIFEVGCWRSMTGHRRRG